MSNCSDASILDGITPFAATERALACSLESQRVTLSKSPPANFAFSGSLPPLGWELLTPSAAKLWMTFVYVGQHGKATLGELAALTGLSVRTVHTSLRELGALGLLRFGSKRGEGIEWELCRVPLNLPDTANRYYAQKIDRQIDDLSARKEKLTWE
jgi:predicted transcriptional regulator